MGDLGVFKVFKILRNSFQGFQGMSMGNVHRWGGCLRFGSYPYMTLTIPMKFKRLLHIQIYSRNLLAWLEMIFDTLVPFRNKRIPKALTN